MKHSFDQIKNAVDNSIIRQKKIKDNIFDIGTKGFYENPFTEVLAYIISTKSHYKNRRFFINSFLKGIGNLQAEVIESFLIELNTSTQHSTLNGKFIDLLIYNSKYILVFENKIDHQLANPLDDYENDIINRYKHLKAYFFVLSYKKIATPASWKNICVRDVFNLMKCDIPDASKNKWDYFVEDFLNHYLPEKIENMDKEQFEFYEKNFSKIAAANEEVNHFIKEVVSRILVYFPIDAIKKTTQHSWDEISKAVRFYPFDTNDNVVMIFRFDGKFSVGVYYYLNPISHLTRLHELVGYSNYRNWKEGSVCCLGRLEDRAFNTLDESINECVNQLKIMIDYTNNNKIDI